MNSLLFVVMRWAAIQKRDRAAPVPAALFIVSLFIFSLIPARLAVPAVAAEVHAADASPDAAAAASSLFQDQIRGILTSRCLKCHSGDHPKGGLDLTRRESILRGADSGPAVDLDNPDSSLLLKAVRYDGIKMPPTGRIPEAESDLLAKWIALGMPWPEDLPQIPVVPERGSPAVNDAAKKFWLSTEFGPIILTSVEKKMDNATFDLIRSVIDGGFSGGLYVGTIANDGVGISPFHDFEDAVPADLKAELVNLRTSIVAGELSTKP